MEGEAFFIAKKYKWLVHLLRTRRCTFQDIKREWKNSSGSQEGELSRRTFYNMINVLKLGGITIECERKDGFRYKCEVLESIDDAEDSELAEIL